jgi:3-phenylpropionate/cinnamic acid dioxygenase small subunit
VRGSPGLSAARDASLSSETAPRPAAILAQNEDREQDMPVSTEDYVAISEHLARYCWLVDEGDEDGWTALWIEDGVFTGVTPEPVLGREALRMIVRMGQASGARKTRHMVANLVCDYRDGRDTVQAAYYNFVTNWADGARMTVMALSKVVLVRNGAGWLIRRNDSEMFIG